jgi:peptidoglycan-associated lipoprotein
MKRKNWVIVAMLLVVPGLMLTASCAKKVVKPEAAVSKAVEVEKKAPAPAPAPMVDSAALAAREKFMKEDVHFAFDSSVLDATAQAILKDKAGWMKNNPDAAVTIEGNCDERGTVAYNLALGERRAESAKAFLVNMGISASKMTTISYGEEKPLDPGHNEQAWAKNRRDHFVIK